MIWDDAAVAKLKELYEKGLSGSQIGAELGRSRNAVIGKIDRSGLRLENRIHGFRNRPAPPAGKRPKEAPRSRVNTGYVGLRERYTPYVPPDPPTPETMKGCTFMQLTDKVCRWPIGDPKDPDFHFCGNDVAGDGVVYCRYHAKISYTTPAQRRAEQQQGAAKTGFAPYGTQS